MCLELRQTARTMATGCIILDSDDDDGPGHPSCPAAVTTARHSPQTNDVAFVDLCSDVDENDAGDMLVEPTPTPPKVARELCTTASEEHAGKGQVITSAPAEALPRTSSGSSATMSEVEMRRCSLWDSDEEELPPLSARLQSCQQPPHQSTSLQKHSAVHKISDSEEENEFPDVSHLIGAAPSAASTSPPLGLDDPYRGTVAVHGANLPRSQATNEDPPAAFTQLKKRTRISTEEREARRVAKEQEKQRRACVTEMGRATKPGHCMKYVTVVLDFRLLDDEASLQLLCDTLGEADIRSEVQTLPVERAICWKRTALSLTQDDCLISREQVEERDVLVVLPWDQFLHLVASQRQDPSKRTQASLSEYMTSIGGVYPEKHLTYVIYGLEKYFKQAKSRANAEYRALVLGSQQVMRKRKPGVYDGVPLTRRDVQETLVPLQLDLGVTFATKESPQELAEYLAKFTRALAERPHREAKQSRPLQHLAAGSLCKHDSLRRTWQAQLEQFASVSRDVAEAIVGQYPAPRLLLQAYQSCNDRTLGETLLADIQVRRGAGALQSTRRVGPVIAGRIYRFFVATDQGAYFD